MENQIKIDTEENCIWVGDEQKGVQVRKDGVFFWEYGVAKPAGENIPMDICPYCGSHIDKTE